MHGLCAHISKCSNIGNPRWKIGVKYGKNHKKIVGWEWVGNVYMVCAHLSKYGNINNPKWKIAGRYGKKYGKNKGWWWGARYRWSVRTLRKVLHFYLLHRISGTTHI
jgi:hypothetical protein